MKKEEQTDTGYPHLLKGANDLVAVFQTPENLLKFLAEATRWHACFKFKSRENDYGTYISIMMEDVTAAWYRNSDGFLDEMAAGVREMEMLAGYNGYNDELLHDIPSYQLQ